MTFVTLALYIHSAPRTDGDAVPPDCEDERVILVPAENRALVAVLDGCGGTGARRYPEAGSWSGARIASHTAGRALYRWFAQLPEERLHTAAASELAKDLHQNLDAAIHETNDTLAGEDAPRFISSRLSKALPTTLSVLTAEAISKEQTRLCSFWAGNSRNYVLQPSGLRQLSYDDLVGYYDPFEDLTKDGILSNSVNASVPFQIHSAETVVSGPCLILSASDGVFSYFDSPIRLEILLLQTLRQAETPAAWEQALREEIGAVAADDHTLQMAVLRYRSFAELKSSFMPRLEELEREYVRPLQQAAETEDQELLQALWQRYRENYLAIKPEEEAEHG